MIQPTIQRQTTTAFSFNSVFYLNLADKIVGTPTFGSTTIGPNTFYYLTFPFFLIKLESQFTGKTKIFTKSTVSFANLGTNVNTYDRSIQLAYSYSVNPDSTEDLSRAEILVGTDEFPLGFYNMTIYQIDTQGELDPANATATLYSGLLNMTASDATTGTGNFESVQYTEYTNNDSENESVYLTN